MWAPVLLTGGALVASAPVEAATVAVRAASDSYRAGQDEVVYAAAPGEPNELALRFVPAASGSGDAWIVSDAGAVIAAGDGCVSTDPHISTDFREPDCEAVTPNPYAGEYDLRGYPAAVTARAVAYRFHCYQHPAIGTIDRCSGTLTLRESTAEGRRLAATHQRGAG